MCRTGFRPLSFSFFARYASSPVALILFQAQGFRMQYAGRTLVAAGYVVAVPVLFRGQLCDMRVVTGGCTTLTPSFDTSYNPQCRRKSGGRVGMTRRWRRSEVVDAKLAERCRW